MCCDCDEWKTCDLKLMTKTHYSRHLFCDLRANYDQIRCLQIKEIKIRNKNWNLIITITIFILYQHMITFSPCRIITNNMRMMTKNCMCINFIQRHCPLEKTKTPNKDHRHWRLQMLYLWTKCWRMNQSKTMLGISVAHIHSLTGDFANNVREDIWSKRRKTNACLSKWGGWKLQTFL